MSGILTSAAVIVGAVISGGATWYSANKSSHAAGRALTQQKAEHEARMAAQRAFEAKLEKAAVAVEKYGKEYLTSATKLEEEFDPYDMEQAFNSLYEAVIMPMERDFDESVLSGIRAAYTGGMMGGGAGLSGAAVEAEGKGRRDLAEKSADLRFQERDKAINRNYTEYDRRLAFFRDKYNVQINPAAVRAEQAPSILQGRNVVSDSRENVIATQLAKENQDAARFGNIATSAYGGALSGFSASSGYRASSGYGGAAGGTADLFGSSGGGSGSGGWGADSSVPGFMDELNALQVRS